MSVSKTSEKISMAFAAEVTDKGGHSSRPTADNPIYRLSEGLARLSKFRFPTHLTETTRQYFERRAAIETGSIRSDMLAAAKASPDPAAVDRLSAVVETNILLRTTCTATQIEGGHAPERAAAARRELTAAMPDHPRRVAVDSVRDTACFACSTIRPSRSASSRQQARKPESGRSRATFCRPSKKWRTSCSRKL